MYIKILSSISDAYMIRTRVRSIIMSMFPKGIFIAQNVTDSEHDCKVSAVWRVCSWRYPTLLIALSVLLTTGHPYHSIIR